MEKTLDELKLEADSLGISYMKNIGADKLQAKIDEWYEARAEENKEQDEPMPETVKATKESARVAALRKIKEQERANLEYVVVKVSMVDKREASIATHTYVSTGDSSANIPLDIFVEIPKILVNILEEARAIVHVDVNGETKAKEQKKFVVEYK